MNEKITPFPERNDTFPRKLENFRREVQNAILKGKADERKLSNYQQAVATYTDERLREEIALVDLNTVSSELEYCMALAGEYNKRAYGAE